MMTGLAVALYFYKSSPFAAHGDARIGSRPKTRAGIPLIRNMITTLSVYCNDLLDHHRLSAPGARSRRPTGLTHAPQCTRAGR
jgi:hypothetical protein